LPKMDLSKIRNTIFSFQKIIFTFVILFTVSCIGEKKLVVKFKNPSAFTDLKLNVNSIQVQNNQLVINGNGLSSVSNVTLTNAGVSQTLAVESASNGQVVANGLAAVSLGVGKVFDMVLSNAFGAATFPVSFTLDNGTVTAAQLNDMGATTGQILKFNGTNWAPASQQDVQTYIGVWNASGALPDVTLSAAGDYYIVSVAAGAYAVGDWIVSDGYSWAKIPYSKTSVASFQGRKGNVVLVPADYVTLKDSVTHKITGSSLNDLADLDLTTVTPTNGSVLKYNGTKWVVGTDSTGVASGSIVDADVSATAAIAQSKINGLAASFTAKEDTTSLAADVRAVPLTGLTSASGVLAATDTILGAFGKMMNTQSDYVSKSAGASVATGTIAVSGTGMITVPTATGVTATEVANVTYVTNAIAANGVWAKSGATINYGAGNVGIGNVTPAKLLDVGGDATFNGILVGKGPGNAALNTIVGDVTSSFTNNTTGFSNTTVGAQSMTSNTTGYYNTAVGRASLNANLIGIDNTAIGTSALQTTTSDRSTAVGFRALMSATTGAYNVGLGAFAGSGISTGAQNTAIGSGAYGGTTGSLNTVVGYNSGSALTTGSNNVILGSNTGSSIAALSNYILLSDGAGVERLRIDNSGNVGIGTTSPSKPLDVMGTANQLRLRNSVVNTEASMMFDAGTVGAFQIGVNSGGGGFWVHDGTTYRMTVKAGGNVGIGTTTPAQTLDVAGTMAVSGNMTGSTLYLTNGVVANQLVLNNANQDVVLTRKAAATLQLGSADAAAPIAQTFGAQSVVAGTTNTSGQNFTFTGSRGTGTGAGGSILFQTAPAGSTGTAQNSLATAMTVAGSGNIGVGTTAPATMLDVRGNSQFENATNSTTAFQILDSTGVESLIADTTTDQITIGKGGLRIKRADNAAAYGTAIYTGGNWVFGQPLQTSKLYSNITTGTSLSLNQFNQVMTVSAWPINASMSALSLDQPTIAPNVSGYDSKLLNFTGTVSSAATTTVRGLHTTLTDNSAAIANTVIGISADVSAGTNASANRYAAILLGGNVGIGTAAPGFALDVNGSIAAVGALQAHSDRKLKKNIVNVDHSVEKLLSLNGVFFDWRKDEFPEIHFEGGRQMGVIAQDVEKVFPEAVSKNKKGIRSVAYTMLIAPIIEAIKEFSHKITELFLRTDEHSRAIATLKSENDRLKNENEEIKARLDKVEKMLSNKKVKNTK
jgi:hypothetical protein